MEIQDNDFINQIIEQWFGTNSDFIKSWIAYYAFTNFSHLPILILTGERGTGKSLFADLIGMIYEKLTGIFDTATVYSEHNGLKLPIIEEADEYDNVKLYSILKDVGGSDKLIRNVKYGPKTLVKNNLNVIVISNSRTPLYLKSKEKPVDENNNQFFVFRFKPIKSKMNNALREELQSRIGHWMRTEIKDLYDLLEARPNKNQCRYQIPVPITKHEQLLFENNMTEIEIILDEFLEELKTDYILAEDLKSLTLWNNVSLHSLKWKLVDMNVIKGMQSFSDKRKLQSVKGHTREKPRYYKLTPDFREKKLGIMPQK